MGDHSEVLQMFVFCFVVSRDRPGIHVAHVRALFKHRYQAVPSGYEPFFLINKKKIFLIQSFPKGNSIEPDGCPCHVKLTRSHFTAYILSNRESHMFFY